ncbi:MAG: DUF5942 domain-containing protein [Phormidesmis sp.]
MRRSISLFLIGLFTVGIVSLLGMSAGVAQKTVSISEPAQVVSDVAQRTADGWIKLNPKFDEKQVLGYTALMKSAAAGMVVPTVANVTPSANTVIVYRWDSIPWKKLALRWVVVLGFTWLIGSAASYSKWSGGYWFGAVLSNVGFFLIAPLYINHIPHWPMAALGSFLPDLGGVFTRASALNPITASALIPFLMLAFLLSHPRFNWMTVGVSVGVAAVLSLSFFVQPSVLWIGSGFWARLFLAANALASLLIAYLGLKTITEPT